MHFLHEDEANTTCSLWQSLSLSCTQTDIYYTHTRALSLTYTSTMNEGNRPVFIWRRKKEDTAGREFVGVFANIIIRWWGMLWGRYTRGGLYNQRRRFELWIGVCGAGNACTLGWIVWMWMTWRRRRRGSSSFYFIGNGNKHSLTADDDDGNDRGRYIFCRAGEVCRSLTHVMSWSMMMMMMAMNRPSSKMAPLKHQQTIIGALLQPSSYTTTHLRHCRAEYQTRSHTHTLTNTHRPSSAMDKQIHICVIIILSLCRADDDIQYTRHTSLNHTHTFIMMCGLLIVSSMRHCSVPVVSMTMWLHDYHPIYNMYLRGVVDCGGHNCIIWSNHHCHCQRLQLRRCD